MGIIGVHPDVAAVGESRSYPVLPLLDAVVFPQSTILLDLGGVASLRAFCCAIRTDGLLLLANQHQAADTPRFQAPIRHRPQDEQPSADRLGKVATLAMVIGATCLSYRARVRLRTLERQQVLLIHQ